MISRNSEGEIVFSVDESDEFEGALKEVLATTEIGKKYRKEYFTKERGNEDAERLVDAAVEVAKDTTGKSLISRPILERALTLLIDSGKIQSKNLHTAQQLEEPEVDSRPRDKNGKLLTDVQIKFGEMARFAATATADAVRQRKHTDHEFLVFLQSQLRKEMQDQPVGDAVVNLNQMAPTKKNPPADVAAYAARYRTMSTTDVKRELSPGMNPHGPAAAAEANRLFNSACAAGLI
jgi:hypothetical protein